MKEAAEFWIVLKIREGGVGLGEGEGSFIIQEDNGETLSPFLRSSELQRKIQTGTYIHGLEHKRNGSRSSDRFSNT